MKVLHKEVKKESCKKFWRCQTNWITFVISFFHMFKTIIKNNKILFKTKISGMRSYKIILDLCTVRYPLVFLSCGVASFAVGSFFFFFACGSVFSLHSSESFKSLSGGDFFVSCALFWGTLEKKDLMPQKGKKKCKNRCKKYKHKAENTPENIFFAKADLFCRWPDGTSLTQILTKYTFSL